MNLLRALKNRLPFLQSAPERYHLWHYTSEVWKTTKWMGVETLKLPLDTWNYQEILWELKPSLLVEFGTNNGGSALFFATMLRSIGNPFHILSVDICHDGVREKTRTDPDIELFTCSSSDPLVTQKIADLRKQFPGPVFAILDSDHSMKHVLAEMIAIRPVLESGDYVIVEDSNVNGHPVIPRHGPGPYEAVDEYFRLHPGDYTHDTERENKFGLTWAPNGYLIRN
jgi:cephalosporin hydroxylase